MKGKFLIGLVFTTLCSVLFATPAMATGIGAQTMSDFATSYGMQGTSDVYYNAPWLVSFVQFFISWTCIIAFLTYYMSYLCSIVVLSNKELFYTIDALKRGDSGGGSGGGGGGGVGGNMGPLNGVFDRFRSGSEASGLNGGADNIAIFFLMLSLNFKAYSVYKNVEAGNDGGGGGGGAAAGEKGPKFAYSDTIASFFLKSLFESVMVTFILSIALSGLLIKMWFTVGDVLIIKADRFAQTNLTAKLDEIIGNDGMYKFTLDNGTNKSGIIGEQIARKIYSNLLAQFPNVTIQQAQEMGVNVENWVWENIMDGGSTGYSSLHRLCNHNRPDGAKLVNGDINDISIVAVSVRDITINTQHESRGAAITAELDDFLPEGTNRTTNLYAHITFNFNDATAKSFVHVD